MKINATNVKRGNFFLYKKNIWEVVRNTFAFQGRGMANVKLKIKSINSEKNIDLTIKSNEQIDIVDVYCKQIQYLYSDKESFYFMNEKYEQYSLQKAVNDSFYKYLQEGKKYYAYFYNDKLLNLRKPEKVILKVDRAEEAIKGDTATSAKKKVITDVGIEILVPLFIKKDDYIVVNPKTGEYVERHK